MAEPTGPFYLLRAGTGQFLCYWGSDGTCDRRGGGVGRGVRRLPGACWCMYWGARGRRESPGLSPPAGQGWICTRLGRVGRARLLLSLCSGARRRSTARCSAVETLASSCSPEKNAARSQQLFLPDPSPRKSRASDLALPAKRKVPGESLINPGFKSKKAPSGVNFEDS
ncbi:PREDICTED: protein PAXX isoform X8 [Ficedula albicollis]|uniref:protein PAXX isoform X8 n=1 Tax=Ficedula albicollis TaxID=59894 RepID=UPI0007AD8BAD|nr:PREDICTED: protein PAXX isoform X8 [Ficedula albicollis]